MPSKHVVWLCPLAQHFMLLALLVFSYASYAGSQITLVGNVLRKCTLDVQASAAASNLQLTLSGSQQVLIGSVGQDCNGRTGYTLDVFSANCASAPAGAKLVDSVAGEYLSYSIESRNPTTGGSAPVVTNLLASSCTSQVARDVTHAIIHNESSTFYINYTGISDLGAGTYQDTVTITITAK